MASTRLVRLATSIALIPAVIGIPAAGMAVASAQTTETTVTSQDTPPAAPVATVVKDETFPGTADGQIGGFTANTAFTVRQVNADGTLGAPVTKTTDIFGVLNGFTAGTYQITYPASQTQAESAPLTVTIGAGEKKEQPAPQKENKTPTTAWGWVRYIFAIIVAIATAVVGWMNLGTK